MTLRVITFKVLIPNFHSTNEICEHTDPTEFLSGLIPMDCFSKKHCINKRGKYKFSLYLSFFVCKRKTFISVYITAVVKSLEDRNLGIS